VIITLHKHYGNGSDSGNGNASAIATTFTHIHLCAPQVMLVARDGPLLNNELDRLGKRFGRERLVVVSQ